jgi:3-hydroxy acid dehydrogenase / malonic semialdehyde reductase
MVLITGASAGIGEACAVAFAKEKRDLILVARREQRLKALVQRLAREFGVTAHGFAVDVCDRDQVQRFASEQKALLSRVKVLVNNAGLSKGLSPIQDGNPDDWEVMLDTNIKGLLYFTRAVLPFFIEKKEGHIVNLGSVAGRWPYPKGNVYCASKAAVTMLSESLRWDLNGTGIRVTEISPGMVNTEFSLVRLGSQEKADAVYAGLTPLTAHDVAETILWSVNRPKHVNIREIVLYPTDQASTTLSHRRPT